MWRPVSRTPSGRGVLARAKGAGEETRVSRRGEDASFARDAAEGVPTKGPRLPAADFPLPVCVEVVGDLVSVMVYEA